MRDQGVEARPALGRVKARDCRVIAAVGAQAINGFSGEGDQFAGAQQIGGGRDGGVRRRQNLNHRDRLRQNHKGVKSARYFAGSAN